jgi:GntR family transcriptional regulator
LFQFFPLVGNDGIRRLPSSRLLFCRYRRSRVGEAKRLALAAGAPVIHIRRLRSLNGRPTVAEDIVLPAALFPGLGLPAGNDLPNTLYDLYERAYGISIAGVTERVSAVSASAIQAKLLELAPGAALLEIDRVAFTVDDKPVEWRLSRCDTSQCHYQVQPKPKALPGV